MSSTQFTSRGQLLEAQLFFADHERSFSFAPLIGLVAALDAACVLCVLLAA